MDPKAPKISKPTIPLITKDYRYLRTVEEVERFLRAARDEGEIVFVLYATAVYTGMRARELAGPLWTNVDLEKRLITVERSYDKH